MQRGSPPKYFSARCYAGAVVCSGGDFCDLAVGKLVALHGCRDLFHGVHVDGHSITGTELSLCVFAPSVNDAFLRQGQRERFAAGNLCDVLAGQYFHHIEIQGIFRCFAVAQASVIRSTRSQDFSFCRQDGRVGFSESNVFDLATIFHQGLHQFRSQIGFSVSLSETTHPLKGRSTKAKSVEVTIFGNQGTSVDPDHSLPKLVNAIDFQFRRSRNRILVSQSELTVFVFSGHPDSSIFRDDHRF
mmetsp:Transcript_26487/g.56764  ORF Transcript_26487/g.56764 Transcript_26487/m.56764 type:complete len:244 (-) Transcript_26487:475-1206(-)